MTGFFRGADVGTAHDFDQRNTRAVEVDKRVVAAVDAAAGATKVGALAGVFFEVGALDANLLAAGKRQETIDVDRLVVLADLIRLGHVGVEVVLAVKRAGLNGAVERKANTHREFYGVTVEHRQRTGQAKRDRIDVGVRLVAETVGAGAEQLGGGGQLYVNLEAHDELPAIDQDLIAGDCASLVDHAAGGAL